MSVPPIEYVQRKHIDVLKWDQSIDRASNGLVYSYSFYLDNMAKHWDALVMGDYDVIMPLTWNKKYGISYLYQPPFTASLGIFGNNLNEEILSRFIASIPSRYKLVEISLNAGNICPASRLFSARNNYILPLDSSYETLYKNYRENIRRNIKKSKQLGARYETDVSVDAIIELSKQHMQTIAQINDDDYRRFKKVYNVLRKRKQAIACGVYLGDQLVASAVYFYSHHRAYYILVGNHPNGKTIGASHYLIDRFIYDHAGQNLTLDFEGSDIGNLAFFYSSFGAKVETYPALRIDNLPWWIKLLRK